MTTLPKSTGRKLGLVIDLDICVGCHACAVACKEWNDGGSGGPLSDLAAYGADPTGVWFNRIHSYEVDGAGSGGCGGGSSGQTVYFPKSCMHCETAECVTVCPTGASYKREEDGIVLVDAETCIGCKLCSWACPYGAREYDQVDRVMKKCTLCVDRIYNDALPEIERVPACVSTCPVGARHFGDLGDPDSAVSALVEDRKGYGLMPEAGYGPVNRYLPPRARRDREQAAAVTLPADLCDDLSPDNRLLKWVDRLFSR
ncbi:4Fe-4S dicluster domain-containing protein [Oceanibacterium hippocampi]|uniref:Tetrathionate reductase subunit B n=1 Tax=Oceanibacterium hippocampi TaxID=745714 RepID=A0A1Y5U3X7_9PROT|nr:4Fe-4S dicluster domain-containing protein [Oceanibacterium hippocampi]SLN76252.1 Tetrathionate reductase subunit B precursor [Oceanibacterium hippocampi]